MRPDDRAEKGNYACEEGPRQEGSGQEGRPREEGSGQEGSGEEEVAEPY